MRATLVAGNWKMFGSLVTNLELLHAVRDGVNGPAEVFGQSDIDGGLIGGASLVAADFLAICAAA